MLHKGSCRRVGRPVIAILATGGTIAGQARHAGSVAEYKPGSLDAKPLLDSVPGLVELAALRCRQIANLGSEDMDEGVWLSLAAALDEESADPAVAGIVVLHGTDTLEETACFLDLCTPSLRHSSRKPVVCTGAMRPADAVSADGPANILAAVRVALCPEAKGRGVLVTMNDTIHLARRVYKSDSLNIAAFSSAGSGAAGRLVDGVPWFYEPPRLCEAQGAFSMAGLKELPRVEIIYGHAGQRRGQVDAALASGAWGVVHAGVGMGNIHASVRAALAEAAAGGVPVVCSSRVPGGIAVATEQNRRDRFISSGFLNPQKARVLLQLALTRTDDFQTIQSFFDAYQ